MKAVDLIFYNEKSMKAMSDCGIKIGDYRHLVLWQDYYALIAQGHKRTYALAVVSKRYKVSERTVTRIVKRFDSEI